jgi:hypothetical protein
MCKITVFLKAFRAFSSKRFSAFTPTPASSLLGDTLVAPFGAPTNPDLRKERAKIREIVPASAFRACLVAG